jgi:hypothetical protein
MVDGRVVVERVPVEPVPGVEVVGAVIVWPATVLVTDPSPPSDPPQLAMTVRQARATAAAAGKIPARPRSAPEGGVERNGPQA